MVNYKNILHNSSQRSMSISLKFIVHLWNLPMQSVHITTDVVSSNLDQDEVYNIISQFVSDLQQVGSFLWVLRFPPTIKLTAMI